jgi:hypothetical protein
MNSPESDKQVAADSHLLRLVATFGPTAFKVALVAAALAAVPGVVHLWWTQPVRRTSALEFRPTFMGARQWLYPNKLPFSQADIIAASVIDHVYDQNEIGTFCERETFRGGFFVEQRSDQSVMLDWEYQARLSETRITAVERRLAQEEYIAKRQALPLAFRLLFVTPSSCQSMPDTVSAKVMLDTLSTWASESETKRGVLNHQVEVLTPSTLDVSHGGSGGWVLRADLLRTALERIIKNIDEVSALPGAELVRLGKDRLTFLEVRGKLVDLVGARLEPLVMTSGRSLVRESLVWVTETVASAERDQHLAETLAEVQRNALREYSGVAQPGDGNRGSSTSGTSSAGAGTSSMPSQLDRSFIDRIVEMSAANIAFRRELTEAMAKAASDAALAQSRASYYRRLLLSLRESGGPQVTSTDVDKRFEEIVQEGKAATKQFNDLYDEFSRVALRSDSAMYQTDKPVTIEVFRQFTQRALAIRVGAVFAGVFVLVFGFGVIRDRIRQAVRS